MNRESSFSLQKIPLRRSLVRSNSIDGRLIFPKGGDSNIFWGVGKKHYSDDHPEPTPALHQPISNPQPSVRKYMSMRNILSVADIEGASPSVAPEKVRNIKRAKEHQLTNGNNADLLGQYEKLFNLKQLSTESQQLSSNSSAVLSTSEYGSPGRRYNPTYVTTFTLQH